MIRSDYQVVLSRAGKASTLTFGSGHEWLFWNDGEHQYVCAVLSEDVIFADEERTRGEMAAINSFHADRPHVRVMEADFDYYVASSAMRGLRPLLGKPPESTPPSEELGQ